MFEKNFYQFHRIMKGTSKDLAWGCDAFALFV